MGRYSERDTTKVYEAADAFRKNCLLQDGSLFFGEKAVWCADTLDRPHKVFVAAPDDGDRQFIDKFRDQVGKAGDDVVRLAAEVFVCLFPFSEQRGWCSKKAGSQ